ncbi:receptor homology region, transmembrane domain- and RING domain-containing protein 1 isoform X2 [Rhodamnia argentea]|uniref:RING-type E3 ubiquitin transferase n=1 Tax=Rhodamnia argentea TaxID=178133 RepID=A0A8B8PMD6_9MYRT|nr:receptor homology region, transmembrane domain- and RING domain-containing protein 1 isoform X2 [Rhodamnia argentea]XP_030535953.1 receptor homology region, transmembrane domain- and RING domain-containing protein 1 isoform X2 [Rhodamnia argentea]XP_030535954.1 receptor homology region, transmembrane domain- and RING domain-containing protein 1 isoform X2 [Rhodamnia argentea]XP_048139332.1 receptor homology region, transmembrane domain- and RING domain-containing protein 1 isoform X2 [Rhodamn
MREAFLGLVISIYCCCSAIQRSSATVVLKPSSTTSFEDLPAKFAVDVDETGICGALEIADPADACSALRDGVRSNGTDLIRFALIVRGNCSFEDKIVSAQTAGFGAVIVYDDRERADLVYMMVNPKGITIPAVFVSNEAGQSLKEHAQVGTGECCIYESCVKAGWTVLAISLISLIVIFGLLALALFVPRPWLYWRGRTHHIKHVDDKIVAELPYFTFNSARSSDKYTREVCAICLEDYKDGEILKTLPCQHEFHSGCVESWLKKGGLFCPVCKHDVRTKRACHETRRETGL